MVLLSPIAVAFISLALTELGSTRNAESRREQAIRVVPRNLTGITLVSIGY
jgi:hypothetical protein